MTLYDRTFAFLERLPGKPMLHVNLIVVLTMVVTLGLALMEPFMPFGIGNAMVTLIALITGYLGAWDTPNRYVHQRSRFVIRAVTVGLVFSCFFYVLNHMVNLVRAPYGNLFVLYLLASLVAVAFFGFFLFLVYRMYRSMRAMLQPAQAWQDPALLEVKPLEKLW